jgi:hypothetical protein
MIDGLLNLARDSDFSHFFIMRYTMSLFYFVSTSVKPKTKPKLLVNRRTDFPFEMQYFNFYYQETEL